jgi:dUTP pyrophosphatase
MADPSPTPLLTFFRLHKDAVLPTRATPQAAGLDLTSVATGMVPPWGSRSFSTGWSIRLPAHVYGRIASRSGLAFGHSIEVGAGVIDRDYRGEVCVLLRNFSDEPYLVHAGDRIAQLLLEEHASEVCRVQEEDAVPVGDTERGTRGFGSTGK